MPLANSSNKLNPVVIECFSRWLRSGPWLGAGFFPLQAVFFSWVWVEAPDF